MVLPPALEFLAEIVEIVKPSLVLSDIVLVLIVGGRKVRLIGQRGCRSLIFVLVLLKKSAE
jgi:hypothetical protein